MLQKTSLSRREIFKWKKVFSNGREDVEIMPLLTTLAIAKKNCSRKTSEISEALNTSYRSTQ